jgi:hypothetical protein
MMSVEKGGAEQIRDRPATVISDHGKGPAGSKSGWRYSPRAFRYEGWVFDECYWKSYVLLA